MNPLTRHLIFSFLLFTSLLGKGVYANTPFIEFLPAGSEVEQTFEVVDSPDDALVVKKRFSDSVKDAIRRNPTLKPYFYDMGLAKAYLGKWLGKHRAPVKTVFALTRAIVGGVVTYWALGFAGDVSWEPKALVAGVYAAVSAAWMWRNADLQTFLDTPLGDLVLGNRVSRTLGLDPDSALGRLMNHDALNAPSTLVRSYLVDLTFEGPKRIAIALTALGQFASDDHVASVAALVGLLTLGQGALEVVVARRTKAEEASITDDLERGGTQLISDGSILALAMLGACGQSLFHVRQYPAALAILGSLAGVGILGFVDEFVSPHAAAVGTKTVSAWKKVIGRRGRLSEGEESTPLCTRAIAVARLPELELVE